jgi:hypothetical protein
MKQLLFLSIAFLLVACNKQEPEQVEPQTPVDVFYKVKGSTQTPKHITCYLWNSNQAHETLELIEKIDTIITSPDATLKITQDHGSYIYAKATFEVEVIEGTDKLEIGISYGDESANKLVLFHSTSCPVEEMSFRNEYLGLYKFNQQKVK